MRTNGIVRERASAGRHLVSLLLLVACLGGTGARDALAQDAATSCAPAMGRVVSIQGSVDVQRAGSHEWLRIRQLDTALCPGDRLRTAPLSRAALFVQPETLVRVDQNTTIALRQSSTEVLVEFFKDDATPAAPGAQCCGAAYFITRFPKKFRVTTAHLNAAVEGTEFMVTMSREGTELAVLEGVVRSQTTATREERAVTAGNRLVAGLAAPAAISALIKPEDAVQWVLRYPPITDQVDVAGLSSAERLLRAGSVDEALAEIDAELSAKPTNTDAHALRAVIQVAKNDKAGARGSARKATELDAGNYRGWLALSYVQQAGFELDAALESARKAESLRADSSLAHARVAELLLSLGDVKRARTAAWAAIAASPAESHAHTMLGFVHLAQIDTTAARADFSAAIDRDSFGALPRLGLGLAMIRDGELIEGREQIEIAVALDPSNSLLRSYVGKAYYEENTRLRDELAKTQFGLAKQLDEMDPTPWFYEAIYAESLNMPASALQELQESIERNGNRAVYRSRLLVDDDAAARTASAANIYENLGFEKLAIVESTKALGENSSNYSAHRQLADAYSNLPRHGIARESEELQAQLRQPVSLASVGRQLGTDSLAIGKDSGPARPGANEFNVLFNQNDVRIQFDGLAGNLDTWGDQFVASALVDRFSIAMTQLHYETDGFVENDAAVKDLYGLLMHGQISASSSIQLEARRADFVVGQTFFAFDEFPLPMTIGDRSDSLRVSGFHDLGASGNVVWSGIVENRKREARSFPDGALFTNSDADPFAAELEYSRRFGAFEIVTGASYIEEIERFELQLVDIHTKSANAFLYAQWNSPSRALGLHAGLAAEWFKERSFSELSPDRDPIDRDQLSPKLGVVWSPAAGTTLRAAAFSAVRRPFVRSQTIEPTQIVGFNQFFTGFESFYGDVNGMVSDRVAAAVDRKFTATTFGGMEFTARKIAVPTFETGRDASWREKTAHAYLYKTFSLAAVGGRSGDWDASFSADFEFESVDRPLLLTGAEGIVDLRTSRAPFALRLFSDRGATLRVETAYISQKGNFSIGEGSPVVEKDDDGWITDVSIEQRLPRRHGTISVGVRNVFDQRIELVEIDPINPRVATRQFVFGSFKIVF
jgi:Tfp pilus assembly protein PilF/outer membrane receptor protein involved in Fe transport